MTDLTKINASLTTIYQGAMLALAIFGVIAGAFAAFYSVSARLSEHDSRFTAIERALSEQKKVETEYEAEMRAAIGNMSTTLTDLRIAIANQYLTRKPAQ